MGKRRAAVLIGVHLLMGLHVLHWLYAGRTLSPVEPSESMFTLEQGYVNAGFVFFAVAILSVLVLGRFVCGWGCHMIALQDLCGWVMEKVAVRPTPFRSRLLAYVPLALALYMFVWPTFVREVAVPLLRKTGWTEALIYLPVSHPFPGFSNHLITEEFTETLPSLAVGIPFFLICGFVAVYFLGSKGFCTYGCPYGGFLTPADRLAPLRIVVDPDRCAQCGHCTGACTSNVRVHDQVREYGAVMDPGCMKTMDCVSICPNDALSYGWARPSILKGQAINERPRRVYDLTWKGELALAGVFAATFFAWRGLYGQIPMLMAGGVAACLTFVFWKLWRLVPGRNVRIIGVQLKRAGKLEIGGIVFATLGLLLVALTAHSVSIRYHRWRGDLIDSRVTVSKQAVFSGDVDAVPRRMQELAGRAIAHYDRAGSWRRGGLGLAETPSIDIRAAWLHLVRGDTAQAADALRRVIDREGPSNSWCADVARIMVLQGQRREAIAYLEQTLAANPEFEQVRDQLGRMMFEDGRGDDVIALYRRALDPADHHHQRQASLRLRLASIYLALGRIGEAADELRVAVKLKPLDARLHLDLARVLRQQGHEQEARREYEQALRLDPTLSDLEVW